MQCCVMCILTTALSLLGKQGHFSLHIFRLLCLLFPGCPLITWALSSLENMYVLPQLEPTVKAEGLGGSVHSAASGEKQMTLNRFVVHLSQYVFLAFKSLLWHVTLDFH